MKHRLVLFLLIFYTANVIAQNKKTIYRQKFVQGNYLILEKNYDLALKYFKEAYEIDSSSANINYKLGICYLQSSTQKYKAVHYLEKAVQNTRHDYSEENPSEKKAPDIANYYLGEAYRLNYNFIASYVYFNKFKTIVGNKNAELTADIDRQLNININAQEFTKDTARVQIVNLGDSINSLYADYSPVISADESTLIFTSRREGGTGNEKTDDGKYMEDIYVSNKKRDGSWSSAKPIGFTINTVANEANIGISPDGQQLFVYKDVNGGDIFYSNLVGTTWSELIPFGNNINSPSWETHASISVDGCTFYFVSDRKEGSYGGRDIWRCIKLPNGAWSLPTNLGPTVNTAADEDAPFIHPDGVTLFFSSNGHKNMGGFDVFKTTKNEDGKWSEPENLRAPINTPDDDIYYVQSADGKRGYISSARKGSFGEKDIYRIDFERSIAEPLTLLKGILSYNGTNKKPANARITVTDEETMQIVQDIKPNESNGKYIMILAPGAKGKTFNVTFEAEGYQPVSLTLAIPPNSSYQEIEKEFMLQVINMESKTPGTIAVKGVVTSKDKNAIPGAMVNIIDNITGNYVQTVYTTADSGSYYFIINRGQNYNVSYEAKGYLFHSENINVPNTTEYMVIEKNIVLDRVEVGSKIVLNNIFFDSNKAMLRKESFVEIEELVKLMNDYPELVIEISGHTDNKGNNASNLILSQKRSQAVVNELIKKGINKTQLIAKGYGETTPIAPNSLSSGKPNVSGMQQNRRVEMKVISY